MSDDGSTHVVVCGGDFAGNAAMRRLVGEPRVRVTLLDKSQPLLYQVATAEVTAEDVCCDLARMFCRHVRVEVRMAEAVAVNPWTGTVTLARGNASNMSDTVTGDHVILAAGCQPNFFHTPGTAEFAFRSTTSTAPRGSPPSCCSCSPTRRRNRSWSTGER
jgi:NADH:ubiquinone reductase (H+-translocating)